MRPTDIQASIANNQFKRIETLKRNRNYNRKQIIKKITKSQKWNNQFKFVKIPKDIKPSWMGLPIIINEKLRNKKKKFINFLEKKSIETRPIISGNFLNQPAAKLYKIDKNKKDFRNAQLIQDLGFLIGLHTKKIKKKQLDLIHDCFFKIDSL